MKKKYFLIFTWIFLAASCLTLTSAAFAKQFIQGRESGGGNQCQLIVQAKLAEIASSSSEISALYKKYGIFVNDIRELIEFVKVDTESDLYHKGYKVDAINYPSTGTIMFDQDSCLKISTSDSAFTILVLHELLGLMGIDDPNNRITKKVYNEFRNKLEILGIYQEPWNWYAGTRSSEFSMELFKKIVKGRSAFEFLNAVIKANGAPKEIFSLRDGEIAIKNEYYYYTSSDPGAVVSIQVFAEDSGKLPEDSIVGKDTLCFFEGARAGTCSHRY